MGLSLVTPPGLDPISLEEAKAHCRVSSDTEDGLLAGYVLAARHYAENWTRRAFLTQSWALTLDHGWPAHHDLDHHSHRRYGYHGIGHFSSHHWHSRIVLSRPPLQAVDSITYVDTDGIIQILGTDQYLVAKADTGEWYIEPAYRVIWPQVRPQMAAITVAFTAGYGDTPGSLPEELRMGMLLLIGQWFDNRTAISLGSAVSELPNAVQALIDPFRVYY